MSEEEREWRPTSWKGSTSARSNLSCPHIFFNPKHLSTKIIRMWWSSPPAWNYLWLHQDQRIIQHASYPRLSTTSLHFSHQTLHQFRPSRLSSELSCFPNEMFCVTSLTSLFNFGDKGGFTIDYHPINDILNGAIWAGCWHGDLLTVAAGPSTQGLEGTYI